LPLGSITLHVEKPKSFAYPKKLTSLGDHIRKKRLDQGLLQKDVAKIIGSDKTSVNSWENNRAYPCLPFLPKIIKFLGYNPFSGEQKTLKDRLLFYRKSTGLSQEQVAALLNVNSNTVGYWEKELHPPRKRMLNKLNTLFMTYQTN
jgi:transcriptional regulator with XRE-family HTH domain